MPTIITFENIIMIKKRAFFEKCIKNAYFYDTHLAELRTNLLGNVLFYLVFVTKFSKLLFENKTNYRTNVTHNYYY